MTFIKTGKQLILIAWGISLLWTLSACGSGGEPSVGGNGLPPFAQQAYLKASNTGSRDEFGVSVSLSGDTLVVGAMSEDSAATGVNGDQLDNNALDSGAAYMFTRTGGVWNQMIYFKASNTGGAVPINGTFQGDQFGSQLALFGNTLAVGVVPEDSAAKGVNGNQADNSAFNSGAAYVFIAQ